MNSVVYAISLMEIYCLAGSWKTQGFAVHKWELIVGVSPLLPLHQNHLQQVLHHILCPCLSEMETILHGLQVQVQVFLDAAG